MRGLPTNKGLYWAGLGVFENYNYIVKIQGNSPFLTFIAWHLKFPTNEAEARVHLSGSRPIKYTFDSEIDDFNYEDKIDIPDKPGLYWAKEDFGKVNSKLVLAYVVGESPYMECYSWDYSSDIRTRVTNVDSLTFIKYIERPIPKKIAGL